MFKVQNRSPHVGLLYRWLIIDTAPDAGYDLQPCPCQQLRGRNGERKAVRSIMTFWPSLFTLAASHVKHIEANLYFNVFQLKPFGRDDAHVALSTIYQAGRSGELVVARAGRRPGISEHPADTARHHLAPACSRPDSRHHRGNFRAARPHLVAGS